VNGGCCERELFWQMAKSMKESFSYPGVKLIVTESTSFRRSMAGSSNIQHCNEKAREFYGDSPLSQRICTAHGITLRDFAAIFGIGKSLAGEILNHQTSETRVGGTDCAYFECTVRIVGCGLTMMGSGDRAGDRPGDGSGYEVGGENRVGAIELAVGKNRVAETKGSCYSLCSDTHVG